LNDREIELTHALLLHLDTLRESMAVQYPATPGTLLQRVDFVEAVAKNLDQLKLACGKDWPAIQPAIASLLKRLSTETDSIRFIALANQLARALLNTPANAYLSEMFVARLVQPPHPYIRILDAIRGAGAIDLVRSGVENVVGNLISGVVGTDIARYIRIGKKARAEMPEPVFHFVLEGEAAARDWIVAGTIAELLFKFGVPDAQAIGLTSHPRLSKAKKAGLDIHLVATASGAVELEGKHTAVARFKKGALTEPAGFQLKASKQAGPATVHVDYFVRGELVHQSEISLQVLSERPASANADSEGKASTPLPAEFLAHATATSTTPPPQRIRLGLDCTSTSFAIDVTTYVAGEIDTDMRYVSHEFDRSKVTVLLRQIHADLGRIYDHAEAWNAFDGEQTEANAQMTSALDHALEYVAAAGSRLNTALRESPELAKALDCVEKHARQGCVLSIATTDLFLPWEILYPKQHSPNMAYGQKDKVDTSLFWGSRFAIETEQRGEGSLIALRDTHLRHGPKVSLNLNNNITINSTGPVRQPADIHSAWVGKLKKNGNAFDGVQDVCGAIRESLQIGQRYTSLIYVYCHGNAPDDLTGKSAVLELSGPGCPLEPRDLAGQAAFPGAPIIFLNACKAAVSSPQISDYFLKSFRQRGALGMIATTAAVPVLFGAHFGTEVIDAYLGRKGSLSAEMLKLRRKYLAMGNPVPLFYSLQCHLDLPFTATCRSPDHA
jgi:hypothetical protein